MSPLPVAAVALVFVGLHGVLGLRQPIRRVMAGNILGAGLFVTFLSLARDGAGTVDPVPQAMVLTGIVVSFATTALALAFVRALGASSESDAEADEEEE